MKGLIPDLDKTIGIVAATIVILILAFGLSWGVVCFITWLITLCFGWEFSLLYGTGVWLIAILFRFAFMPIPKKK